MNTTTSTTNIAQDTTTRNTPSKFRRPILGKMQRAMLDAGAVEYQDSFVIFFEDVTAVILDAQNFYFDIWAQPSYTASVVVLDADTGEWVQYDSGAELLEVLATL